MVYALKLILCILAAVFAHASGRYDREKEVTEFIFLFLIAVVIGFAGSTFPWGS